MRAALALGDEVVLDPLVVLRHRQGLCDERPNPRAGGDPGAGRVVVRHVHQRVGGDARSLAGGLVVADHVGIDGLQHVGELARVVVGDREDETVAQQVEDHGAKLAVLDLPERLPRCDAFEAGRAVHGQHARERRREQQMGLVDLQRDPRALLLGQLLLADQRAVDHVQDELEQHARGALSERSDRARDDQDVAVPDDLVDRERERVPQDRVELRAAR